MDTTCGSFALKGARVLKNAAVVDLLIQAGMIIIAKTNLSVSRERKTPGAIVGD